MSFYKKSGKRILDIALSLCAMIVLSPLLAVTALLVRIKLGHPVIFKQERAGCIDKKTGKEKRFLLLKFRSMLDAIGPDGEPLPDTERLTKFGRILRASSLDELPELINIFKGDMSIVGPRPLPTRYLPYYTKKEHQRHQVRPGLTGLAQVSGRNALSWEDKFAFDLEYSERCSLLYDSKIVLLTIQRVIASKDIGQGEQAPVSLHIERENWLDGNGVIKPTYADLEMKSEQQGNRQ